MDRSDRSLLPKFVQLLDKANRNLEKIDLPDEVSDQQYDKCGSYMVNMEGLASFWLARTLE